MKKDIDTLFKELGGSFDVHETPAGHQSRFLEKLSASQESKPKGISWWKSLSIAATIALLIAVGYSQLRPENPQADLASVSSEMKQTQSFFTATINEELKTLKSFEAPETKKLVDDAMHQITILEREYETLKVDLVESGNDKRVIYAMITNFKNRIDLLQQVIQTIETITNFKSNENEITI